MLGFGPPEVTALLALPNLRWGWWHPGLHLVLEISGYCLSWAVYRQQRIADVLTPDVRRRLRVWILVGAILGAKIVPVLEQWDMPWGWTAWLSGKSLAGALLGGIVGAEVGKARHGVFMATGDVLVWPLVAGTLAGRLGCASCAVLDGMLGAPIPQALWTLFPWVALLGVDTTWPDTAALPAILAKQLNRGWVWNVAALEWLGVALLAMGLAWLRPGRVPWQPGQWFYVFCGGYFSLRLLLEPLKHMETVPGLRVVQVVGVLGLVFSLWQWGRLHCRGKALPTARGCKH
jgi:prolipoprotein diacylglyceryltransferase